MTAKGWVRTLVCSPEEHLHRAKLGEPPPTEWKRRLYLEWYSQNGRVVLEMAGMHIEELVRESENIDDEGDWAPLPHHAPPPQRDQPEAKNGPAATIVVSDDGSGPSIETFRADDETPFEPLERAFVEEAAAIDRSIQGDSEEEEDDVRAARLMDACLEKGGGEFIAGILGNAARIPPPDRFDDDEVESLLKMILGQLAVKGIALSLCEHYTPRDAYELLRNEILPNQKAYKELAGTGWVQHFMTSEHCAACDAEFEAKFEEEQRKREQ